MSEHYYRVREHGQPNPGQWVMWRKGDWDWRGPSMFGKFYEWGADVEWFPVEAPPSELAPEPEGVEVDQCHYKVGSGWSMGSQMDYVYARTDAKHPWSQMGAVDEYQHKARVAAALGLVDQPPVPRALVDWLRRAAKASENTPGSPMTMVPAAGLLHMIECGEFGPVEGER